MGRAWFFAAANGTALSLDEWLNVARQFEKLPEKPVIILWGGEPLFSPFFDELANELFNMGFTLEIITNGTMNDLLAEDMFFFEFVIAGICKDCFRND